MCCPAMLKYGREVVEWLKRTVFLAFWLLWWSLLQDVLLLANVYPQRRSVFIASIVMIALFLICMWSAQTMYAFPESAGHATAKDWASNTWPRWLRYCMAIPIVGAPLCSHCMSVSGRFAEVHHGMLTFLHAFPQYIVNVSFMMETGTITLLNIISLAVSYCTLMLTVYTLRSTEHWNAANNPEMQSRLRWVALSEGIPLHTLELLHFIPLLLEYFYFKNARLTSTTLAWLMLCFQLPKLLFVLLVNQRGKYLWAIDWERQKMQSILLLLPVAILVSLFPLPVAWHCIEFTRYSHIQVGEEKRWMTHNLALLTAYLPIAYGSMFYLLALEPSDTTVVLLLVSLALVVAVLAGLWCSWRGVRHDPVAWLLKT